MGLLVGMRIPYLPFGVASYAAHFPSLSERRAFLDRRSSLEFQLYFPLFTNLVHTTLLASWFSTLKDWCDLFFHFATMQGRMTEDRIRELLEPFLVLTSLSDSQLKLVSTYLDLLLKWNSKINLTAVREPEEIVSRHFGESLFAARQLFPDRDSATTAIDIGSGAGFPGLPFKIWSPPLDLTLIEANQKKAVFLREIVRTLGLKHVSVLAQRAETVQVRADLVSLRAVERFEKALPGAGRRLNPGGRVALLIGNGQTETAKLLLPSVCWEEPVPIPLSRSRVLLVGQSE